MELVSSYERMRRWRLLQPPERKSEEPADEVLRQSGLGAWMQAWLSRARPPAPEGRGFFWNRSPERRTKDRLPLPRVSLPLTRLLAAMVGQAIGGSGGASKEGRQGMLDDAVAGRRRGASR